MSTRRDFLYAGALVAPGLMLTDPLLHALYRAPGALNAEELDQRRPEWPRTPVARQIYSFNQGWRFYREDAGAPTVPAQKHDRVKTQAFRGLERGEDIG